MATSLKIATGVPRTAAAHVMADGRPITVVWSTIPVACIDWLSSDVTSQGPVHQPADQVPDIWDSSCDSLGIWQAITEIQCEVCARLIGPKAIVRNGYIVGNELANAAREVAIEYLITREVAVCRLPSHVLGIGLRGGEVVGWAFMSNPNSEGGSEIVEVALSQFRLPD